MRFSVVIRSHLKARKTRRLHDKQVFNSEKCISGYSTMRLYLLVIRKNRSKIGLNSK
eukprot:COSAG06_NODE_1492_length_9279_cov_835.540632_11_plen_57_part_00